MFRYYKHLTTFALLILAGSFIAGCSDDGSNNLNAHFSQVRQIADDYNTTMARMWTGEIDRDAGRKATNEARATLGDLRDALIENGADVNATNAAIEANDVYLGELGDALAGRSSAPVVARSALAMHRAYQEVFQGAPNIGGLEPRYPGMESYIGLLYRDEFGKDPSPPTREELVIWHTWWDQTGGYLGGAGDASGRTYPEDPTVEPVSDLSLPTRSSFSQFRSAYLYYDGLATFKAGDCPATLERAFLSSANATNVSVGGPWAHPSYGLLTAAITGCRDNTIGGHQNLPPAD